MCKESGNTSWVDWKTYSGKFVSHYRSSILYENMNHICFFLLIRSVARHQIRILLRLSLHYANIRLKYWNLTRAVFAVLRKIVNIYFELMRYGTDIFTIDPALLSEWYRFTVNSPKPVAEVLT